MNFPSPAALLATTLTLTLAILGINLVLIDNIDAFFKESGGVEILSAILLLAAIPIWFWRKGLRGGLAGWQIPAALALLAMRELDFDKRFTENGVLKLRYYTGDGPWTDKIAGILVLLVIAAVVLTLLRRNLSDWLSRLRRREVGAWLLAAAIQAIGFAKSIDGLGRKLAPLGIDLPSPMLTRAGRIEELLELVFAILLIQAIAYARRRA